MNKLTLSKGKAMACLAIMCLFLAQSCRKDNLMPNASDSVERAKNWYNQKFDKSTSTLMSINGYSFPLDIKPKWNEVQASRLDDQTDIYIVPLEVDVPLELRQTINPVLVMHEKATGYEVKSINDDQNAHRILKKDETRSYDAKSLYQKAFGSEQRKLSDVSNVVLTNKSSGGNIKSSSSNTQTIAQNKIMTGDPSSVGGGKCIDWYLVTRDQDGVIISEEFVGRTCGIDEMPGGGGPGGGPGTSGNPADFGLDPKCLNCQILVDNFDAFLQYLKTINYIASDPFGTTVELNGVSFHGTMVEIRLNGALTGSFFTPDYSYDRYTPGIYYSVGFRGSDGYGPAPNFGYGLTGLTFPVTYYNGKTSLFLMPPGGVTYTTPGQDLISILSITDVSIKSFLAASPDVSSGVLEYLRINGKTAETIDFANWSVGYLFNNRNFEEFKNAFLNFKADGSDGPEDFDENYWNDPNLVIQQQTLPTLFEFSLAYPKSGFGKAEFEMSAPEVFDLVGGTPKALRDASLSDSDPYNNNTYSNACALRVSRALNYSGVTIPEVSGTYKGGDGKNYFLSAASLNAWMTKTFPPTASNSVRLTAANAGKNGEGFATALNGLNGIYIMIPNYPGPTYFGASGHAGFYTTPPVTHYYFTAKGGVSKITLWKLQ
ncbi:T6SS effector amidase Tae4 family protein [Pedobacter nototheniae]|uniref:T6SS effector amidase Tae4 family protein n=1 Tax=Pedobacter nototheniae TaxID=2488994 RepID=UPI00103C0008|nr:T6SS effector amidase Tae4 family protein [Pedobacter nototheniae]